MISNAQSKVVCVLGAAGGVGVTTVAANLAVSLHHGRRAQAVAVMDTTLTGGDLPLMLGMEPVAGLQPCPTDPQRIDEVLLMHAQAAHPSGVKLLRLGRNSSLRSAAEPAVLARTLDLMGRWYEWLIVDCGCAAEAVLHTVIPRAHTVLLVTTLRLPAAQRARQLVEWLLDNGVPGGTLVGVVNRYREDEEPYRRHVPSLLPCRIGTYLSDSPELVHGALIDGKPLLALGARAALARGYAELARTVSGPPVADSGPHAGRLLQRIHARFMGRRHAA